MTEKRMRSPRYPSTQLGDAIDIIEKMFNQSRTHPLGRDVAVQAMGYSGMTGRSAKVLSDLSQFGLLEKAGTSEVRVSELAVSILHPDDDRERYDAIKRAAENPELFRELGERFSGGAVSGPTLRSYLLKRGFTDAALNAAIRAYEGTREFVSAQAAPSGGSDSTVGHDDSKVGRQLGPVDTSNQLIRSRPNVSAAPQQDIRVQPIDEPTFNMVGKSNILLGGTVKSKEDAKRVIAFMNAVIPLLDDSKKTAYQEHSDPVDERLPEP